MDASRNKRCTDPVIEAVRDCLARHAPLASHLVVGFSGGLDSTVLLHAVAQHLPAAEYRLSALHVHHGLSSNADGWEEFCATQCQKWGLPFRSVHGEVPKGTGLGIEASARQLRQRAFAECGADFVLLAHHADDQAETLLHNLLRGAGVKGAGGMAVANGMLLRPFLALPRQTLLAYAESNKLAWIEDESNSDTRYTRNYLRSEVFPVLSARFPRAGEQLASAAARFREAQQLLDELAMVDLQGTSPSFPLPLSVLRAAAPARARNLLRAMLAWHAALAPDESRLTEFIRQIQNAGPDRHPRLDLDAYSLSCAKGMLHFERH